MVGISNLKTLLNSMNPKLVDGEFVFCTISESRFSKLKIIPLLIFKEEEGITLIIKRNMAESNFLSYTEIWAWIILTVHSDLSAVGFLARITSKLAESGISVNVVSAYYHDHLFVPVNHANRAVILLQELSASKI
ncbi:MAG: ACT domain-containing protein [Candidatus Heimdallarchaeota archaeon]|nr:MAG: ACT domain-containing protein [Candidatus Heimdallarchaeota archaeon]